MANETVERIREHRENRKKNRGRKVGDRQAQAIAKFIRVPPRKARLVMDEVRGRFADEAAAFLKFIPNRAAGYIYKVLMSAVANAANNHDLNPANLKLVEGRVDEGPRMKRVQPRAQGRAYRILKRMSHITIIVEEVDREPRKARKATGSRAQAARAAKQPQAAAPKAAAPAPAPVVEEETPEVVVAEETAPMVAAEETAAEETAPVAESAAEETVTQEEQVANTEDTTDEIGAPTSTDEE